MNLLLQHKFELPIWRIYQSESGHASWVIEIRDTTKREVILYFINEDFSIKKINYDAGWWSGIEVVYKNLIVFHHFDQEDLPIHKGIIVFNAVLERVIWQNDFVRFISLYHRQLEVKPLIGLTDKSIALSLETGEEELLENQKAASSNMPIVIDFENKYFADISEFLKTYINYEPYKLVEYLELESYIIISYYLNMDKLENYLLVSDTEGTEVLHVCLGNDLKAPSSATFTVSNGYLSFVKDRNELFITDLI